MIGRTIPVLTAGWITYDAADRTDGRAPTLGCIEASRQHLVRRAIEASVVARQMRDRSLGR